MTGLTAPLAAPVLNQISDTDINNANPPSDPMRVSPKTVQAEYQQEENGDQTFTVPGQSFTTMVYSM
jgi:hypothetical protein